MGRCWVPQIYSVVVVRWGISWLVERYPGQLVTIVHRVFYTYFGDVHICKQMYMQSWWWASAISAQPKLIDQKLVYKLHCNSIYIDVTVATQRKISCPAQSADQQPVR